MARKGQTKIRQPTPDSVYQSIAISKLINSTMRQGKKNAATKQVYGALELIKKDHPKEDALTLFEQALDNIKPKVEVRPRRIGGAVYQVPTAVRGNRQLALALRWLIQSSRAKSNKEFHTFAEKLASEISLALKSEGQSITKRQDVEKMAEANKAFAHLRW